MGNAGMGAQAPDWEAIERSPDFQRLVSSRRRFAWTAGTIGIGLGALYVVLAGVAPDLMGTQLFGVDVARVRRRRRPDRPHLGDHARLHATAPTACGGRSRSASARGARGARAAHRPVRPRGRARCRRDGARAMTVLAIADGVNELALGVFAVVLAITLLHHVLGVQADAHRDRVLGGQPRHLRPAERLRDRRRLPVGVDLPRLRRAHLPVRRRRLGRPRRRGRVVPARRAAARRAHAQLRQVHDRRRARPSACASGRRGSPRRSARSSSRSST